MQNTSNKNWFERSRRRSVLDMHIPDWNPDFLSDYSPKNYVDLLVKTGTQSAVIYANSHVGLCNYPTKTGKTHNAFVSRDILGETIDLCSQNGIVVVAYYSLIFNNWAYKTFPEWRVICADGREALEVERKTSCMAASSRRYGVCCPNSPYRDFVVQQIEELVKNYDFQGIRFDMTFWPYVCYCDHCRKRFAKEFGGTLPKTVDWNNKQWTTFQRSREKWLTEFAQLCTDTVKMIKPAVSVEHQSSSYTFSWKYGVTSSLSNANDFLQGDFYGDLLQGSFICKLFSNLSPHMPFGFETSSNIHLYDHTTRKPKDLLEVNAFTAAAHNGAFIFIDAVDPRGTVQEDVYSLVGDLYQELAPYDKYSLPAALEQDVAVYFSTESKFTPETFGEEPLTAVEDMPHLEAALGAVRALIQNHIPFGIVTKESLEDLNKFKVLILPNVLSLSSKEIERIRNYVANGGSVYASKYTSLFSSEDGKRDDFGLADVFGLRYLGETEEVISYMAPARNSGIDWLKDYSLEKPLCAMGRQIKCRLSSNAQIISNLVLPYTNPDDPWIFSSIHSNPPGKKTDYITAAIQNYGKGRCVYFAADIERVPYFGKIFTNIISSLSPEPFFFKVKGPKSVELVALKEREQNRYRLNLLNYQSELPNIPVHDVEISISLDAKDVKRLYFIPGEKEIEFFEADRGIHFTVPYLETFQMVGLEYGEER